MIYDKADWILKKKFWQIEIHIEIEPFWEWAEEPGYFENN